MILKRNNKLLYIYQFPSLGLSLYKTITLYNIFIVI
jgi:hypothetical protein